MSTESKTVETTFQNFKELFEPRYSKEIPLFTQKLNALLEAVREATLAAEREKQETLAKALKRVVDRLPIGGNPLHDISMTMDDWKFILAALAATEPEPRKERCKLCQRETGNWVDPDWAKGRVCFTCEAVHDEIERRVKLAALEIQDAPEPGDGE